MTSERRTGTHMTPRMADAAVKAARGHGLSDARVVQATQMKLEQGVRPAGLNQRQDAGLNRAVAAAKSAEPK